MRRKFHFLYIYFLPFFSRKGTLEAMKKNQFLVVISWLTISWGAKGSTLVHLYDLLPCLLLLYLIWENHFLKVFFFPLSKIKHRLSIFLFLPPPSSMWCELNERLYTNQTTKRSAITDWSSIWGGHRHPHVETNWIKNQLNWWFSFLPQC